jgi:sialic acid synthase SpsE
MTSDIPKIVCEIGINHEGSVDKAIALLEDIAKNGLEYVKFQIWDRDYFANDPCKEVFDKFHIPFEGYCHRIIPAARRLGLKWGASTFGDMAFHFVMPENPDFYKVASRRAGDKALAQKLLDAGYTDKPVLVSHGMDDHRSYDNRRTWEALNAKHLHCISEYPTPPENAQLGYIDGYQYDGYSDHTEGVDAMVVAGILGAEWIEKHIKYDRQAPDATPDICCSVFAYEIVEAAEQIAKLRKYL